jgi:hypothetical protein
MASDTIGDVPMLTLCIRYTLDPNRIAEFREYVDQELPALRAAGGRIGGYWLPTDFAGPTNIAYGLIDFETLAAYERYRAVLAADPLHQRNVEALTASGAVLNTARSIIRRAADG